MRTADAHRIKEARSACAGRTAESFLDQTLLFAFVPASEPTAGLALAARRRTRRVSSEQAAELPGDETPRAHVLRFFLAPDEGLRVRILRDRRGLDRFFVQRIELLDADDGGVA